MGRPKITIVGAGNVGATAAQRLAEKDCYDLALVDIVEGIPQGKSLDLSQAGSICGYHTRLTGSNAYDQTDGSLLVVITSGVPRKPGMSRDELFGPVVMFGLGGVFVEVLRDVTFRVPPFGRVEARRMLGELRGRALLDGVRGRPGADKDAIVDVIMRVQRLAVDLAGEIAELDINPLVARPDGCVALDALVVPA